MSRFAVLSSSLLAFSIPFAAAAEPPSGAYWIPVGGVHAMFLPTEVGSPACQSAEGVTVCFGGAISTAASGDITGSAVAEFSGDVAGDLAATFTGTMVGSADTVLRLAMTMSGEVSSAGAMQDVEARGRWRCVESATSSGFICSGRMRRCLFDASNDVDCESEPSELYLAAQGGAWYVYLELATDANGIVGGTASVYLPNGLVVDYNVSGAYDARTDRATLHLVAAGAAQDSALRLSQVVLSNGAATGGELRYRIAGQKGRTHLPAPVDPIGEPFPGHGTCISGGFCDTSADTSSFFGGHGPTGTVTIDDTIFFGILGATSRPR